MEAPRDLEIATFKWYDDIRNPAELFFSNFLEAPCCFTYNADCEGLFFFIIEWSLEGRSHAFSFFFFKY